MLKQMRMLRNKRIYQPSAYYQFKLIKLDVPVQMGQQLCSKQLYGFGSQQTMETIKDVQEKINSSQKPSNNSQERMNDDCKIDDEIELEYDNPYCKSQKRVLIGVWLMGCALWVVLIILIGGYTRIKNAGLSMVYWKPLSLSYPSTIEQWEKEFEEYKKYPEYQYNNASLEQFKFIFFLEWFHRVLARGMGIVFVLPLGYFMKRGYLKPKLKRSLGLAGILGCLQGGIGWWMVYSGLEKKHDYQMRPKVSTYRLITHLSMALTIFSILSYQSMNCLSGIKPQMVSKQVLLQSIRNRKWAVMILHFVALNLISGAMVAGIEGGRLFNTWPDMNGQFLPAGYLPNQSVWDLFENRGTAQFHHRMFGYLTYLSVLVLFIKSRKMRLLKKQHRAINLMFLIVNYQLYMGITTLLSLCEPKNASAHQGGGVVMLASTLYFLNTCRKPTGAVLKAIR